MISYDTFEKLDMDLSALGFIEPDSQEGYFCTPIGARIIGRLGVDGIHFCQLEGFGETVFAVNPTAVPGEYVHPVAGSFEDFLRLLLACKDASVLEQAWMASRAEFDAMTKGGGFADDKRTALTALANELSLSPMEDPYGYITELQAAFDPAALPFPSEYYEIVPDDPESMECTHSYEWKVYFDRGFDTACCGALEAGTEIPVHKIFEWDSKTWHIPAAYSFKNGLVIDFCAEIDPQAERAYLEKWSAFGAGNASRAPEQEEQQWLEDPMAAGFSAKLCAGKVELPLVSGSGTGRIPRTLRQEFELSDENDWDSDAARLIEHYGLDPEKVWFFWRQSYRRNSGPLPSSLTLLMSQEPRAVYGCRFTVKGVGDEITLLHPITGQTHVLRVAEYDDEEIDTTNLPEAFVYPRHCTVMAYTLEPDLPESEARVLDCGAGDTPRLRTLPEVEGTVPAAIGIIGGCDGPTAILVAADAPGEFHCAVSALRFQAPEKIDWQMVFYHKDTPDMVLDLPLSPCLEK